MLVEAGPDEGSGKTQVMGILAPFPALDFIAQKMPILTAIKDSQTEKLY